MAVRLIPTDELPVDCVKVRRRDSGFAKQDIVPIGRNKERPVLWVKKAHTVDRGISKAYGHVCALEYCNPQVFITWCLKRCAFTKFLHSPTSVNFLHHA